MSFPIEQIENFPFSKAAISCSSSGSNTILAAVAGKRYRVCAYHLTVDSTVAITWKSSTTTNLTGAMNMTQGISVPFCEVGWFETAVGEALTLNLSAGVQVSGCLVYQLIG